MVGHLCGFRSADCNGICGFSPALHCSKVNCILSSSSRNLEISIFLKSWLLENSYVPSVMSHFLDFPCSLKSRVAIFAFEEAMQSSSLYWLTLGWKLLSALEGALHFLRPLMDTPAPHFFFPLILVGGFSHDCILSLVLPSQSSCQHTSVCFLKDDDIL